MKKVPDRARDPWRKRIGVEPTGDLSAAHWI